MSKKCCQCGIVFDTPGIVCQTCRESRTPKWKNPLRFLVPEGEKAAIEPKEEEVPSSH